MSDKRRYEEHTTGLEGVRTPDDGIGWLRARHDVSEAVAKELMVRARENCRNQRRAALVADIALSAATLRYGRGGELRRLTAAIEAMPKAAELASAL